MESEREPFRPQSIPPHFTKCLAGLAGHEMVNERVLIFALAECLLSTLPYLQVGAFSRHDGQGFTMFRSVVNWITMTPGPVSVPSMLYRLPSFPWNVATDEEVAP